LSIQLHDATPNTKPNTTMKTIESHTNATGTTYYSTTDENGQTIYSFTEDFEDIWTQDDQDAIEADSAPSKI
jgi:hypothetical protein